MALFALSVARGSLRIASRHLRPAKASGDEFEQQGGDGTRQRKAVVANGTGSEGDRESRSGAEQVRPTESGRAPDCGTPWGTEPARANAGNPTGNHARIRHGRTARSAERGIRAGPAHGRCQ